MLEQHVTRDSYNHVMVPTYNPISVIPVRGKGAWLWDQQGKDYVDFAGGIAVSCLGHCHPALVKALTQQAERLWHLSNVATNEPAIRLAEKLVQATFAQAVFFCSSGAEANEAALKLARRYSIEKFNEDKIEIIAFDKAFHGRTFFTVSAGGQPAYADKFGPKPGGITHLPYNDLAAVKARISDKTCAVFLEPVQGEGGIVPATPAFLQGVKALCEAHDALLIFDEVQCGVGRTGSLYAYMDSGVVPDILTSAKSLGGGFPIGAMLTTKKIASVFQLGTHGSTYGGNPMACAVAETVLDLINNANTLNGVKAREHLMRDELLAINQTFNCFQEIRGQGLLLGAVLNEKFSGRARELLNISVEHGVMVLVAGPNVIRFTPSLIIPEADIQTGMQRFKNAVAQLAESV